MGFFCGTSIPRAAVAGPDRSPATPVAGHDEGESQMAAHPAEHPSRLLKRLVNMRRGELPLAARCPPSSSSWSCAATSSCARCAKPWVSRAAWTSCAGSSSMTSVTALGAVLAFGGVVARMNRRRFIPVAYLFVIACLIGFAALLIQDVRSGGGLIGTDAQTGAVAGRRLHLLHLADRHQPVHHQRLLGVHGGHLRRGPGEAAVRLRRDRGHARGAGGRLDGQSDQRGRPSPPTCPPD